MLCEQRNVQDPNYGDPYCTSDQIDLRYLHDWSCINFRHQIALVMSNFVAQSAIKP